MNKEELIKKITEKKEFSDLPEEDVEIVFQKFDNSKYSDEEKIKLARDLLRRVYSVFTSGKLLNKKIIDKKSPEEILKKHVSTRERYRFYPELYHKLLEREDSKSEVSVIDLGAGINGLSYDFFPKSKKVNYLGVEAVGQLANLMEYYFDRNKFKNAAALKKSLFNLEEIKRIIKGTKKPRIVFLFKVIDSLEMVRRDYSKKLLLEITPLVERVTISFATKSLGRQKKFFADRKWIKAFIQKNFKIEDEFEISGERYFVFSKKDL